MKNMSLRREEKENLISAIETLETFCREADPDRELDRAGTIQGFEFTFELLWKTLKKAAEREGGSFTPSPKGTLKVAFQYQWIEDESVWIAMLADRNLTSHTYRKDVSIQIFENIQKSYLSRFLSFKKSLS